MTRTFLMLLVCLVHLTASAQWTKVDNFVKNGRPASALAEARRLLDAATTPGERMQALLCVGQMQQELTPDSFFNTATTLMQWHRTAPDCAERAVTAVTLARLLEANQWRSQYRGKVADVRPDDMRLWSRADYRAVIDSLRTVAYNQPFDSLHAIKANTWTPFVEMATEGRNVLTSRWWGDDLLHVILADAPDSVWTRAKQFYATVGCHEPQIEDYIRRCRDSIDVCRDGIEKFPNEKRVAVLKNELMRIECPQFGLFSQETYYPGHEYTFKIEVKNVSRYTMQTYRLAAEPKHWNETTVRAQGKAVGRPVVGEMAGNDTVRQRYTAPRQPGLYALIVTPTPTRDVKKVNPIVIPVRVSPYQLLQLEKPDGQQRFVVTDALSGKPVEGVKVKVERRRVSIEGDAQGSMFVGNLNPYRADTSTRSTYSLFTDRAIYRPGQTVQMSLVAYKAQAKSAQVLKGKEIIVHWRTAKYEQIQTDTLRTDTFGTATTTLTLPTDAETGIWMIQTEHGHASFRVEEYKRPTFAIEMEQIDTPLVVRLSAKSFTGVPVRGARVTGHYSISQPWWWRNYTRNAGTYGVDTVLDTLTTDANGHALIRLPLPSVETSFAQLILNVDVTSTAGETHSETLRLPLRRDELAIQADVPKLVERSRITPWDVKLVDATGRTVPGEITCTMHNAQCIMHNAVLSQVPLSELPQLLATLPTALYRVTFTHGDVKSEAHTFSLFSTDDTFTPDTVHFYATADTLPCRLHIGSCLDSVTFFVNAYDGKEVVWDKQIVLNKEAHTLDLAPATHSDGITVSLAFVKNEAVEIWTNTFTNPRPDNRLRWHWDTFRDRTTPGCKERWSGTLLRPDGTPASANVMLTIYDASLDALTPHGWQLAFQPRMQTSWCTWIGLHRNSGWMHHAAFTLPLLRKPELICHHFSTKYLDGIVMLGDRMMYKTAPLMAASGAPVRREMTAGKQSAVTNAVEDMAVADEADDDFETSEPQAPGAQLRSDFSEQAVFAPSLRTDAEGRFTLDFTLPESVTTWQVLGIAHTTDMMTATTRQQSVARKDVMVQLGVPRFMRLGDEGSVTATVSNLTPESLSATLTVYTSNRLTSVNRLIASPSNRQVFSLSLSANSDTTIVVPLTATATGDMTVSATVTTATHSDGEQRSIPVIDSRSWTTETIDLTTSPTPIPSPKGRGEGQQVWIAMTPAPVWAAISALPAMMQPDADDAISLANAYFATTLTSHLATIMPQIQERRHFPLDSLKTAADGWCRTLERLQQPDGSFAWFPCGSGSTFITTEVAVELARLQQLTGQKTPLLDRAMDYLSRQTDERIAWMKKHNAKTVDASSFYYLYASALMGRKARQADFLLPLMVKELTAYDINSRAIAAVVLHYYNKEKEARRFLTSLNEHIVTTAGRGAYFDYPGGSFTSIDRKLQTLTTAIEAKTLMADTLHLAGLRHNLLQQRRTQGWDNKLFATAAVAAILNSPSPIPSRGEGSVMLRVDKAKHTIDCDTTIVLAKVPRQVQITPLPTGGEGGGATPWAALFIKRLQHNDSIESTHTGIEVRREVAHEARVGDRLTVRYTIIADRDYEWVRLTAPRPACLEAAEQLSGYRYQNGLYYYVSQRDDREDFFFERLPRGTYIIESQCFADRPGTYTSGITSIECLYAPEFTSHTGNAKTTVTK